MDITKTVQSELQAIESVAAAAQGVSEIFDCADLLAALVFIDYAPSSGSANTPGTEFRIQVSQKDSGDDGWVDLPGCSFVLGKAITAPTSGVDGTEAAGATTIEESATGTLAAGQWVFFKNSTVGNSEWSKVVTVTANTSFVIQDGLTNAQTGSTWYGQAERLAIHVDLSTVTRLRVICNNNVGASSIEVHWRVAIITADAIA